MKRSALALAVLLAVAAFPAASSAIPVELALWSPVQLASPDEDVCGGRLALYGVNRDFTGLDLSVWGVAEGTFKGLQIGLLYDETAGDFKGVQDTWVVSRVLGNLYGIDWGWINLVDGDTYGLVGGLVNLAGGDLYGLELGAYSQVRGTMQGVQFGLVNNVSQLTGLQLGLVNIADLGRGLQIGIINIFGDGFFPVFPVVNFNF
jgi:hypothetical protein